MMPRKVATPKPPDTLESENKDAMDQYLKLRGHHISWERKIRAGHRFISSRPRGWADGIGWTRDGRFLAIERKRECGDLGEHGVAKRAHFDEQRAFIDNVIACGGVGLFARSVKDLEAAGL